MLSASFLFSFGYSPSMRAAATVLPPIGALVCCGVHARLHTTHDGQPASRQLARQQQLRHASAIGARLPRPDHPRYQASPKRRVLTNPAQAGSPRSTSRSDRLRPRASKTEPPTSATSSCSRRRCASVRGELRQLPAGMPAPRARLTGLEHRSASRRVARSLWRHSTHHAGRRVNISHGFVDHAKLTSSNS